MQKYDVPELAVTLNGLAEVFDKKPVPQKALEMWFETLKEFPAERVFGLLSNWPKAHVKFPAPAEVWKPLNEWGIDERGRAAERTRGKIVREYARMGATEQGARAMALIREMLSRPKPTSFEHWRKVMATPGLCDLSYEYAKKYLKAHEPKQDDEDFNKQVADIDSPCFHL